LSELVHGPLLRDFPGIRPDDVRIVLVEGADRLLAGMPPKLGAFALDRLRRRRVDVRLHALVERVEQAAVGLAGGERIDTETVVWTAGIQGEPRAAAWGLPVARGGRVPVTEHLHIEARPEVFVIGDLAYREDADGHPLPQVAQVAIQQGRSVAATVRRRLAGEAPRPFRYRDPGMLAVIGRNAAVAHVFGRSFKGWPAWALWLAIHISWLIGFRNRALVLLNWGWNYVFFRRTIRLILPTLTVAPRDPPPAVETDVPTTARRRRASETLDHPVER
jgi:NADH dehydrogenase